MQNVRFEIKIIEKSQTLVLDSPAQAIFLNNGAAGSIVTINQGLILSSVVDFQAGAPFNPYSFKFETNTGEIDQTNY